MAGFRFRQETVDRFLDLVAGEAPAPGGGAVVAMATALAAGLVGMSARFSNRQLDDAAELAGKADDLRNRAVDLAEADAAAYEDVRAAYALPRDDQDRNECIRTVLERATDIPLEVARAAAETATVASRLATHGNPNLRGDALIAVLLAEAAVRGAAELVKLNVHLGGLHGEWQEQVVRSLALAEAATGRASPQRSVDSGSETPAPGS